jgi:hypothetical protein
LGWRERRVQLIWPIHFFALVEGLLFRLGSAMLRIAGGGLPSG